jgi:hypothetical protein
MQTFWSISTTPSSARLEIAFTGQEAKQAGCSQWLQALVTNVKTGWGYTPLSFFTTQR